jgi:hypothetical protein
MRFGLPSEEGIEISNMDNVFLYADNDRVTDIFTTYNVSMKEALEIDNCFFRNIIKTVLNIFKYILYGWGFLPI